MADKNKSNHKETRLARVTELFLDNLKDKGPVDEVARSMTFHEKHQMDDALTVIFSKCADDVGTPVLPEQIRLPSQESLEILSGGIKLAEMFARSALRIMPEADLARMMPVRMLERDVLDGLEQEGAHTLAKLGRKALAMEKQRK